MNFGLWLLKRMKRKIFGDEWGWLFKYRRAIQDEMPIAIIATFFCGLLWLLVMGALTIYFVDDKEIGQLIMKCILACPPLFFIYNWFYTLYEIYDTERKAVWEELKR
jgi:hypothetical protein